MFFQKSVLHWPPSSQVRVFFERNESIIKLCWGFCFCTHGVRARVPSRGKEGQGGVPVGAQLLEKRPITQTHTPQVSICSRRRMPPVPAGSLWVKRPGRPGSETAAWMPLQSVHHGSSRSYGQDEGEGLWSVQAGQTSGLKISEEVMELDYLLNLIVVLIFCHLSRAVHRACS